MKSISQTLCVVLIAAAVIGCRKNKDAEYGDGPAERAGEDVDEASRDAEESMEEAGEEMEESMDEARKDLDGDPTTD
jgi:hypothetical protein